MNVNASIVVPVYNEINLIAIKLQHVIILEHIYNPLNINLLKAIYMINDLM